MSAFVVGGADRRAAAHQRRETGPVLVDEVEEPAHHPQQPRAQRPLVRFHEPARQIVGGTPQRGLVQAEFAGEVVVDQRPGDARGRRYLVDGDIVGRAVAEQFERDADQLLPPLLDAHSAAYPGRHANT